MRRIITHFNHKKPAVFIECERDRINHQRFGRDKFQTEPIAELKSFQGIAGGHRRKSWKILRVSRSLRGERQSRAAAI
jgi:hypothetical protein